MGYLEIARPTPRVEVRLPMLRHDGRRRQALDQYAILDTEPEDSFGQLALLASELFDAPYAAISFLDDDRQWFKARCGLNVCETPIEHSFCNYTSRQDTNFVIEDTLLDARFATNPLVTGGLKIRFYAGMHVKAADGTPIGALCVFDRKPRPTGITPVQDLALQVLAAQVEALLELRRAVHDQGKQLELLGKLSQQLSHVAEHDGLTGLPYREPFQKHMVAALQRSRKDGTRVAVMFIDVDHFKQVNDTLGHDAGDEILRCFAARLKKMLRSTDKIARLGGDEFGAVLCDISSERTLSALVDSIVQRLNEPIRHKGRLIECHASIGVAIFPDHALTAERLMKCSDLALASAKEVRACAVTFDAGLSEQFERETRMLEIARTGLSRGRIVPYYQAKINLESGKLIGLEALVRCTQASLDPLLPESFAHALADTEVARQIGETMLERVLDDIRLWTDRGLDFGHVALNTSVADFRSDNFGERLLNGLSVRGLKPHQVEIEVTEGVFLGRGADFVARALDLLSTAGVRISLDDFGTGYASLTHLKQFPLDAIKIDRSFVDGIGKRADDTTIVKALIGLGQSLGIETIAEGLETEKQVAFVKAQGCSVGQGFYFGKAVPAELVPLSVADWSRRLRPIANAFN